MRAGAGGRWQSWAPPTRACLLHSVKASWAAVSGMRPRILTGNLFQGVDGFLLGTHSYAKAPSGMPFGIWPRVVLPHFGQAFSQSRNSLTKALYHGVSATWRRKVSTRGSCSSDSPQFHKPGGLGVQPRPLLRMVQLATESARHAPIARRASDRWAPPAVCAFGPGQNWGTCSYSRSAASPAPQARQCGSSPPRALISGP